MHRQHFLEEISNQQFSPRKRNHRNYFHIQHTHTDDGGVFNATSSNKLKIQFSIIQGKDSSLNLLLLASSLFCNIQKYLCFLPILVLAASLAALYNIYIASL